MWCYTYFKNNYRTLNNIHLKKSELWQIMNILIVLLHCYRYAMETILDYAMETILDYPQQKQRVRRAN